MTETTRRTERTTEALAYDRGLRRGGATAAMGGFCDSRGLRFSDLVPMEEMVLHGRENARERERGGAR